MAFNFHQTSQSQRKLSEENNSIAIYICIFLNSWTLAGIRTEDRLLLRRKRWPPRQAKMFNHWFLESLLLFCCTVNLTKAIDCCKHLLFRGLASAQKDLIWSQKIFWSVLQNLSLETGRKEEKISAVENTVWKNAFNRPPPTPLHGEVPK
jgi:hypothetical protein